jgi:hypothetical protein
VQFDVAKSATGNIKRNGEVDTEILGRELSNERKRELCKTDNEAVHLSSVLNSRVQKHKL